MLWPSRRTRATISCANIRINARVNEIHKVVPRTLRSGPVPETSGVDSAPTTPKTHRVSQDPAAQSASMAVVQASVTDPATTVPRYLSGLRSSGLGTGKARAAEEVDDV